MNSLRVQDLCKEYASPDHTLSVLRGVQLEAAAGNNLAVLGPSGSGKSTLLQILGTLDKPTSGSIWINEQNPFALKPGALARFRNEHIGFVFQDHQLLPQLNVIENVLLPVLARGGVPETELAYARELIERVGLTQRATHRPGELSGGERQRAAIARALICKPSLILADEPTGNLDRKTAADAARLLLELPAQTGAVLIVVTHSLELARLCQRRFEIVEGRLEQTT